MPLSVTIAPQQTAVVAGRRLGALLARRRATGKRIALAISSDMAHYPTAAESDRVTAALLLSIRRLDAAALARAERDALDTGPAGLVCGMCGIAPAVFGLAALRAFGATRGIRLADATSADAGGPDDRTVGYLAVATLRRGEDRRLGMCCYVEVEGFPAHLRDVCRSSPLHGAVR